MGENSSIEWTDHTWNPWYGCQKVSAGCKNCYMFREMRRYGKEPSLIARSKSTFYKPLRWAERWPGSRVFACSWSDWFLPVADAWRPQAWDIIRQTPQLHYLILTKRPELAVARLPDDWGAGWPHVWLGTSIEDQATARMRLRHLLEIPAQHRFLSLEPLLGYVDLVSAVPTPTADDDIWDRVNEQDDDCEPEEFIEECEAELDWINYGHDLVVNPGHREWMIHRRILARLHRLESEIHWVIAGGETGPEARPCHPDWVRALRDVCAEWGVPFFFKGWGDLAPLEADPALAADGRGSSVQFLAVGKRQAGRLLDGCEWLQLPEQFRR